MKGAARANVFAAWILLLMIVWQLWLHRLAVHDLSFDETATWYIARRSLPEIFQYLRAAIYEHPPLYYLLMHFWMKTIGESEFSLRVFSVALGILALPLAGWLARPTPAGIIRGWVPAVILAAMPGFVDYARTARMYSLVTVWAILAAGLFFRDWMNIHGWPRRQAVLRLLIIHLLALFTHYYSLLFIAVQPLILLITKRWKPLIAWIVVSGLLAIPGLVWFLYAEGLRVSVQGYRLLYQIPQMADLSRLLNRMIFALDSPQPELPYVLAALAVLLLLASRRLRSQSIAVGQICWFAIPVLVAYQLPRIPEARYLIYVLPILAWAVGYLIVVYLRLIATSPGSLLIGATTVMLAWGIAQNGLPRVLNPKEGGYGSVLRQIQHCSRPRDGVLFYGPWQWLLFEYYNPGRLPPITTLPPQAPPRLSPEEAESVLRDLLRHYHRLWVLPAAVNDVDPIHFAEGWLNIHAHRIRQTPDFTLYASPLVSSVAPYRAIGEIFGGLLRLDRVEWEAHVVPPGSPLRITLHWTVVDSLPSDVRISLVLEDQHGQIWNSANRIPGEWGHPPSRWRVRERIVDREGLWIPSGAPPGKYTVHLLVADEQTGRVLTTDLDKRERIFLFTVIVRDPSPDDLQRWDCELPNSRPITFCSPSGDPCLTLLGGEYPERLFPGYPAPITLHWGAAAKPLPDLQLRVELVSQRFLGASSLGRLTLPLLPDYPSSQWTPGRMISQKLHIEVPLTASPGPAYMRIEISDAKGIPWRTPDGQSSLSLSGLRIEHRPTLQHPPPWMHPIRVAFGDALELRAYLIEGEARPGGTLHLTYVWYTRAHPERVYAVFNHLTTLDGLVVAIVDGWPKGGHWLTNLWLPGDYIMDRFVMNIPTDAPPGPYRLSMGMYDVQNHERLPAVQKGQRLPEDRVYLPLP
ncbi:MAG: hypothetical protein QW734_09450 [Candidatus Bathyarchaeia archaeon]